jgi:hypothetical protein
MTNIRVIQYGLGPIGCAVARLIVEREGLELVGGVDIDPAKVGQDVGRAIGLGRDLGFAVSGRAGELFKTARADVVAHTTSSHFDGFMPQLVGILEAGLDVVSTSEELAYPWLAHQEQARELDEIAKKHGKTLLGTGINPGFLMDALPITLTGICQSVEQIEVQRVINASTRRGPFQVKIGSGLTPGEFQARIESGQMGHVGLRESMDMVLEALGKKLEAVEMEAGPVLADRAIKTDFLEVQPGQVRGLRQVARGYVAGRLFISLIFVAALEAEDEQDTITIKGRPDLTVVLKGTNGDLATVAMAVNALPRVLAAPPGLVTMKDLPPVTAWYTRSG